MSPPDVRRYVAHIARRGVSDHTVRLALAPLRALLATAYEDGAIATNPAAGVRAVVARPDREPAESERARALTDDELEQLLAKTRIGGGCSSDDLPPSPFAAPGGHERDTRASETAGEPTAAELPGPAQLRAIEG